jgi:hypothetical protein
MFSYTISDKNSIRLFSKCLAIHMKECLKIEDWILTQYGNDMKLIISKYENKNKKNK